MSDPDIPSLNDKENTLKFLQTIYVDATNTIRHYDVQRSTLGSLLSAGITVMTTAVWTVFDKDIPVFVPAACWALLAIFSAIFAFASAKMAHLILLQRERAKEAMRLYELHTGDVVLTPINISARSKSSRSLMAKTSINSIWISMFTILSFSNAALSVSYISGYLR